MAQLMQLGQPGKGKPTDTIIGSGLVFTNALVKGSGVIRIDGHFTGDIDIDGHIILGETGVICGEVNAESAMIAGQFTGNLNIQDTLHLTATADLEGKIGAGSLKIDEGAAFAAVCTVAKTSGWKDIALDESDTPKALKDKKDKHAKRKGPEEEEEADSRGGDGDGEDESGGGESEDNG